MHLRTPAVILMLWAGTLQAQGEGSFEAPPEMVAEVCRLSFQIPGSTEARLQALLRHIFRPSSQGGMGIVYANDRTRTVAEVWRDRKANCLSMTAFYVAACRAIGIKVDYAEAMNTNRWRKVDGVVRFERHVVAIYHRPWGDLVADFAPDLRRKVGLYMVAMLTETRFRALFHSNRAVELLAEGLTEDAMKEAKQCLEVDAKCGIGWNTLGVVHKGAGDLRAAEESFRKALALDRKDGTAIGNLEMVCRESGRDSEAAEFRKLGDQMRKKDPYFQAFVGEEALGNGDLDTARQRIRAALSLQPHEAEFHLLSARLKLAQGNLEGAVKDIEEAKRWANPEERERYDGKLARLKEAKP